ncbi:hypothetical protein EV421DRAFT_1771277 [Armillaria borealis]|uniref:Uncharacterized protein n=1 Tax=Armillaria borealis TaxID=47425 RepID=A0AA39MYN4_9AGAR|nr:hypothetical protein EV421DRAFT_1771277 [Armillaria borealis]
MARTAAMPATSVTDVYQHLSLPFFFFCLYGVGQMFIAKKDLKFTDPPGSLTTRPRRMAFCAHVTVFVAIPLSDGLATRWGYPLSPRQQGTEGKRLS